MEDRTSGREKLIDDTLAYWNSRYDGRLNRVDAQEILDNLVGLFELLSHFEARGKERLPLLAPHIVAPGPPLLPAVQAALCANMTCSTGSASPAPCSS